MESPTVRKTALLLAGSGFCALVYQTAWLRLLCLVFGASTAASSATLAIFMAGLGLGGWLLGRRADRWRRPLALYAGLEAGIAVAAALSPALLRLVERAYVGLGGSLALGSFGGTIVRLVLSAIVLGIPTFLMGGTLPAAVRAVERSEDSGRRRVGWLYAANTLGAVAGALVPTFLAFEAIGIRRTLWGAALLNLLVAGAAGWLARGFPASPESEADAEAIIGAAGGPVGSPRPAAAAFVAIAAAGVGFAFLLMEIVWYRMLTPLLGGSSYTFGLILAVALAGMGLGGLAYGAGWPWRRPSLAAFAATCALEALFLAAPFALGDRLAVFAALGHRAAGGFAGLVVSWTAVTALAVFPAALVAGYQFPLLIGFLGSGRRRVGREVGATYAANTAGAIAGAIAGGFGLLPLLGAPGVWRLVAGLLILLAAVALALAGREPRRLRAALLPAAAGAAGLLLLAAPGPGPFWRHSPIGAGRVPADWSGPNDLEREIRQRRLQIVWETDGVESSVALHVDREVAFLINGKSDGSALSDAPTQVMSGLVGAMLHAQPRRSLVIGLGTGSTAGWLGRVPSMERVDAVELEPAVAGIARQFGTVNQRALDNPKIHLRFGDGREALLTGSDSCDLIFSEPSNPYRAGVASLFSADFYRAVRKRLAPDGIFLQWLQGYEVDPQVVRTAYATLGGVFPAVESWELQGSDLLLVASERPIVHDIDRVRLRAEAEPYRSALWNVWGVEGAEGFYAGFIAGPALARGFVRQEGGRWNTDDHPILEYGFAKNVGKLGLWSLADLRGLAATGHQDRPAFASGARQPLDFERSRELRTARRAFWGRAWATGESFTGPAERRESARQAFVRDDLRGACALWLAQPEPPLSHSDRLLLGECLAVAGDPRAPRVAADLATRQPIEAGLLLALWRHAREEDGAAVLLLADAFAAWRGDPWVSRHLGEKALDAAVDITRLHPEEGERLFASLGQPFAARSLEHLRLRRRVELADLFDRQGHCVEAFAPFEPNAPWEEDFLAARAACYAATGNPRADEAVDDLNRFRAAAPAKPEATGKAGW